MNHFKCFFFSLLGSLVTQFEKIMKREDPTEDPCYSKIHREDLLWASRVLNSNSKLSPACPTVTSIGLEMSTMIKFCENSQHESRSARSISLSDPLQRNVFFNHNRPVLDRFSTGPGFVRRGSSKQVLRARRAPTFQRLWRCTNRRQRGDNGRRM